MDEALREVLRADPRVAFALVFGSVARGQATPHSDLDIANEAPSPIAYRIFRDGRLIFEADRKTRVELQTRAILEYLDFQWVEELCARGVIKAAARRAESQSRS